MRLFTAVIALSVLACVDTSPNPEPAIATVETPPDTEPSSALTTEHLHFQDLPIGQTAAQTFHLLSTGSEPLKVFSVGLTGETPFEVVPPDHLHSPIPPGEMMSFQVLFTPVDTEMAMSHVHLITNAGNRLVRVTGAGLDQKIEPPPVTQIKVPLPELGAAATCPTAIGLVAEGEKVIPQTLIHLFGEESEDAVAWEWSVQQPTGSVSHLVPNPNVPNPVFEANVAGEYKFKLDVWDQEGNKSCKSWVQTVLVCADEAVHIELLWHTPADPDETDEGPSAGTDLDLHFAHADLAATGPDVDEDGAPDVWFDQPFDTFWFNAHPNWGSFNPEIDDDPGLDRDDTDGAGPENLNLNIPETGEYRIGVHYWGDHGYGESFATIRVYVYGALVFEAVDVRMDNLDLWDVATLHWPSGAVIPTLTEDGDWKVIPEYKNPFFFQP